MDESHVHLDMSREIDSSDLNVLMLFYSDRVTIWVAVSSHEITDPYFIEDENENPVTVNQERYQQNILRNFAAHEICRFAKSGATSHTAA